MQCVLLVCITALERNAGTVCLNTKGLDETLFGTYQDKCIILHNDVIIATYCK